MSNLTDIITEKIVLAGLYQHGADLYYEVADIINSDSFSDESNSAIFTTIKNIYLNKQYSKVDFPSLVSTLNELGFGYIVDDKNELTHLKSISNTNVERENIYGWCLKLRKLQTARELQQYLREASKKLDGVIGSESFDEIIGIAESPITNFAQSLELTTKGGITLIHNGIDEYIQNVENNPVDLIGIGTGYTKLDYQIGGGIRKGTITLLGARTGYGKSLFSINIGLFVSLYSQIPVLYIDTEMGLIDHQPRILSSMTYDDEYKVGIREIETGKYINDAIKTRNVRNALNKFKQSKFYYASVSGETFEYHLPKMRKFIYQIVGFNSNGGANDCLIIYDYMKIGSANMLSNNIQERQALAFMMMQMHDFARKYQVPIFMLTQLNREGIDKEDQSVIRGSDSALDPVTNFCIFKEKSPEEIAKDTIQQGNAKVVVLKSRHGEINRGGSYISFHNIGKYGKVLEVKT